MKSYKIIADENIPGLEHGFARLGEVIKVNGRSLNRQQLVDADILLVRSVTTVDRELLAGTGIRFVGSATIGTDHLDTDYLNGEGIAWANAPGSNANSVVEYVLSAFARVDGLLEKLLAGATVGIIGLGNVGGRLYRRLDALGINCVGFDPLLDQSAYPILGSLESVLAADVVCLHTPLTRTATHPSYHLLAKAQLEQLREGAVLLNAGRGAVIDNSALRELLDRRSDLTVILDVWEHEPRIDRELMAKVLFATPHIAGYSLDGKLAGTAMIFEACCRALAHSMLTQTMDPEPRQTLALVNPGLAGFREAIFTAYDIAADDRAMRQALAKGDAQDSGRAFDDLRKNYPLRREFSYYRVAVAGGLDEVLVDYLKASEFELNVSSES